MLKLYDFPFLVFADTEEEIKCQTRSCGNGYRQASAVVEFLNQYKKIAPYSYKYFIKKTDLSLYDFSNDVVLNHGIGPRFFRLDFAINPTIIFYNREYIPVMRKQRQEMIKTGIMNYNSKYAFPLEIKFKKNFIWFKRNQMIHIFKKGDILFKTYNGDKYQAEATWLESFMGDDPDMPLDVPLERLFPDVNFLQKNILFQLID